MLKLVHLTIKQKHIYNLFDNISYEDNDGDIDRKKQKK